jgi:hypothetical protein
MCLSLYVSIAMSHYDTGDRSMDQIEEDQRYLSIYVSKETLLIINIF